MALLLLGGPVLWAQGEEKREEKGDPKVRKTALARLDSLRLLEADTNFSYHLTFPNVGKTPYYYDKKELLAIQKMIDKKQWDAVLPRLESYVQKFGIENFYRNTELIWRLGQLYEQLGRKREAKECYRLVLKHHRTDIVKEIKDFYDIRGVASTFDTLTRLERDYFVPLDYYYELVEFRRAVDTLRPPKSVLLNMGPSVNEPQVAEYGPALGMADSVLIYTKRLEYKEGLYSTTNEDLYWSRSLGDDQWSEARPLKFPVNTDFREGSATLTRDGQTLYFTRCLMRNGYEDCDLYWSERLTDSTWGPANNLGERVNSPNWDSHPTLSRTEDTLFFASDRIGGFGLSDLYFCVKIGPNQWGPASNMGPILNTRRNELSPFYHPVYDVLYFASEGHLVNFDRIDDYGARTKTLDLYKAHLIASQWQEPKNLGPLVNSEGNEFYFCIDRRSRNLYYAKTEEGAENLNHTDLYSFPLPMEANPLATTKVRGFIYDPETGEPYDGIVSIIDVERGIEVAPKALREDGSFEFDLIDESEYLIVIQGDDFFRIEKLFYLDGDTSFATEVEPVRDRKLTFAELDFNSGSSEILPSMEPHLRDVINFMIDNPDYVLTISGHTDSDGSAEANLRLSQARADAIRRYIMEEGFVTSDRITAIGYGETHPIRKPEVTAEDKRINRRVEFEIRYAPEVRGAFEEMLLEYEAEEAAEWEGMGE